MSKKGININVNTGPGGLSNVPPTQKDIDTVFDEIAGYGGIFADMVEAVRDNRNPLQDFHDSQEKK